MKRSAKCTYAHTKNKQTKMRIRKENTFSCGPRKDVELVEKRESYRFGTVVAQRLDMWRIMK